MTDEPAADGSPPGLDLRALSAHLGHGPLTAELIAGGRSNLTYLVRGQGGSWIVRRPPLGHVLATAHDMAREYRVLSALADTSVPVPRPDLLCQDPSVLGAPFYVMRYVEGEVYRSAASAAALGLDRLTTLAGELGRVLARLHTTDPAQVGLADFGHPEGYLERQLRRWSKQLDASRSRELPGIDELRDRLAAALPPTPRAAIVHGDYRLDNVIFGPDDRIAAVVDWEMATLGDPLTDIGALLLYWELLVTGQGLFGKVPPGAEFPATSALLEPYLAEGGAGLEHLPWYLAFATFKLAVIAEGIHYRFQAGQTVGAGFERLGAAVPVLVARGHAILTEGH
ncbi:phosphotransferase family protein [Actinospica durhamensis]|uniref:Phosphotransferase family protein n=1 Tax=Actinospica durhamensis TaxID=1508375 RepID=A0A941ERX7_9ACTN|nr:phosphotransferase family protein [Actinospica durhamensis]MBR7832714.1 phosphotransferase family protein [Actinospica durhamensis]